jgi:hypothetical protein
MGLVRISPGERGFEERTFECRTCHGIKKVSFAIDPLKTDAVGWLLSETENRHASSLYQCEGNGVALNRS